jgi:hypothetical protein
VGGCFKRLDFMSELMVEEGSIVRDLATRKCWHVALVSKDKVTLIRCDTTRDESMDGFFERFQVEAI